MYNPPPAFGVPLQWRGIFTVKLMLVQRYSMVLISLFGGVAGKA
jgi:hypothetical protein